MVSYERISPGGTGDAVGGVERVGELKANASCHPERSEGSSRTGFDPRGEDPSLRSGRQLLPRADLGCHPGGTAIAVVLLAVFSMPAVERDREELLDPVAEHEDDEGEARGE